MENGYDLNLIGCDFIKRSKGKAPNDHASESFVDNWIQVRIANNSRERVVDPLHELDVQICALVGVPFAGLGSSASASGVNRMIICGLARLHEFSFDFIPGAALSGIGSGRLQPSIEFSLLSIG